MVYIGGGEHIESFTQNIVSITFEMQTNAICLVVTKSFNLI